MHSCKNRKKFRWTIECLIFKTLNFSYQFPQIYCKNLSRLHQPPCFFYRYCKRKRFAVRQIQRALNERLCVRARQDKSRLTLHVHDSANHNSRRNESETGYKPSTLLIFRVRDIKGFYLPIFVQCSSAFSNRGLARHFPQCQHEIVLAGLLRSCCHHGHTRIQT